MSAPSSRLARNGSYTSSTTSSGSVDNSSHNHMHIQIPSFPSWLRECYSPQNQRHERILLGVSSSALAILTKQQIDMHIQRLPDIRGLLDIIPVIQHSSQNFVGGRAKLGTWPLSKHEALVAKQYAV